MEQNLNKLQKLYDDLNIERVYNSLCGYQASFNIFIGPGSIGKTHTWQTRVLTNIMKDPNACFAMFVENQVMAQTLNKSKGIRLFNRLLDYLKIKRPQVYEYIKSFTTEKDTVAIKSVGGTVYLGERVIGFILPLTEFSKIKGSSYKITDILFDEFIPEKETYQTLQYVQALVSVINTVARADKCRFWLLANPIRMSSPILDMFGLSHIKPGETLQVKDEHGVLAVAHYYTTNNPAYKALREYLDQTPAYRIAKKAELLYRIDGTEFARPDLNHHIGDVEYWRQDGIRKGKTGRELEMWATMRRIMEIPCALGKGAYKYTLKHNHAIIHVCNNGGQWFLYKTRKVPRPVYYCLDPQFQDQKVVFVKGMKEKLREDLAKRSFNYHVENHGVYTLYKLILGLND